MRSFLKFSLALTAVAAPAVPASAEIIFALTTSNQLVTFDSSSPGTITSTGSISGLDGDVLTGIDFRPANNMLYSVATDGTLYTITAADGGGYTANALGNLAPPPSGTSFGIDFNPAVDRLRFVSDTNQNLRINAISPPGTIEDIALTLNGGSAIDLVGVAYTNSVFGAQSTTLYGLDALTDSLVRATNANAGTFVSTNLGGTAFGPLGVTFTSGDRVGFDISGFSGTGYFNVNETLYSVNLTSGAASSIGSLGVGGIIGIAVAPVPEPATWAMMIGGFAMVGGAMRSARRKRTIAFSAA